MITDRKTALSEAAQIASKYFTSAGMFSKGMTLDAQGLIAWAEWLLADEGPKVGDRYEKIADLPESWVAEIFLEGGTSTRAYYVLTGTVADHGLQK